MITILTVKKLSTHFFGTTIYYLKINSNFVSISVDLKIHLIFISISVDLSKYKNHVYKTKLKNFFTNLSVLRKFHHKLLTIQKSNKSFSLLKTVMYYPVWKQYRYSTQQIFRDFPNESGATARLSCNYSPNYCFFTEDINTSKHNNQNTFTHTYQTQRRLCLFFSQQITRARNFISG